MNTSEFLTRAKVKQESAMSGYRNFTGADGVRLAVNVIESAGAAYIALIIYAILTGTT